MPWSVELVDAASEAAMDNRAKQMVFFHLPVSIWFKPIVYFGRRSFRWSPAYVMDIGHVDFGKHLKASRVKRTITFYCFLVLNSSFFFPIIFLQLHLVKQLIPFYWSKSKNEKSKRMHHKHTNLRVWFTVNSFRFCWEIVLATFNL